MCTAERNSKNDIEGGWEVQREGGAESGTEKSRFEPFRAESSSATLLVGDKQVFSMKGAYNLDNVHSTC